MIIDVMLDNDGGSWGAYAEAPELKGFITATASSRDLVIAEIESALRFHIAGLRADGVELSNTTQLAIREIVETRELLAA